MYYVDPEEKEIKEEKKEKVNQLGSSVQVTVLDRMTVFFMYLDESVVIRTRYGFGKKQEGVLVKYFIQNKEILDKLDPVRKEWCREWVKQKMKEGKWE